MFDVTPHLLAFDGGNPTFVKAYERFFKERAEYYYEHFSNEYCMETYQRHWDRHSPMNPPFIIAIDCKNDTRSPFIYRNHFNSLVNVFDSFHYHLCYFENKKNLTPKQLPLMTYGPSSEGYVSIPLGHQRLTEVHTFSPREYVRHLIYYLLPEDYHYFNQCHDFFREHAFLPLNIPGRQNPLEG